MDWTHIATYGGIGAFVLALLQLIINKGPLALGRIYADRIKQEEAERAERREERGQLIELVKNNTAAMTHVATAVEVLSRDVSHLYTILQVPRPSSPGEIKRVDE